MLDEFIPRAMQPTLKQALEVFPVATICGPRQSGKTTLCRLEFPDLPYANLEDLTTRRSASEDPKGFLYQFPKGVIIDEVQLCPDLFSQIQVLVDEDRFNRNNTRKFLLTGSSNFSFLPQIRQSLAGRSSFLTLLPFSTSELILGGFKITADEEIIRGGYPNVWTNPENKTRFILENYINSYVERDVKRLINIEDYEKFSTLLRLCASRIGYELNKSSLAVETGISVPTVERWLSVLSTSYIIYLLPPWHSNISKRLVKSPKLYFYDTGIACTLLGIDTISKLTGHPLRGSLFENLVINNVVKAGFNKGLKKDLFFYRDKSGREVDLIFENEKGLSGFEIKSGMTYNVDFRKNIDYLKAILGEKLNNKGIIYNGDVENPYGEVALINYKNFPKD